MKWERTHVGQHRMVISPEESEAQKEAGLVPGITPDLHAPEITHPGDEAEVNLHGDVPGSPYSSTPGEISLAEAAKRAQGDGADLVDDNRDTRAREVESRVTGVPTEALAAEDEAEGDAPKPKSSKAKK